MAIAVWLMAGIALWHFTVFLPDRFWQGIIGAFLGAALGSVVVGLLVYAALGEGLGTTNVGTALLAVPGTALGLGVVWAIGARQERRALEST